MGSQTHRLAGVVAGAAEHRGQRIVLAGDTGGALEITVADPAHVLGDLLVDVADVGARGLDAVEGTEPARRLGVGALVGRLVEGGVRHHGLGVSREVKGGGIPG